MKPAEPGRRDLPYVAIDPGVRARLDVFRDLLLRWNARINLVADHDAALIDRRHIADSLQLLPLLPTHGPVADLGSGAGFPGLVLAIASGLETHLVESDRRKAAFLIEAARVTGALHIHVHAARADSVILPPLTAITARAFAPLADILPHAARMLAPDGVAILPKGRTAEAELTDAARAWTMQVERYRSRTESTATIFRLSKIERAGA